MSTDVRNTPSAYVGTITERGQVTLPADIRRRLGVKPRDKVIFRIDEHGGVRVESMKYTLETLKGSLPHLPGGTSPDFSEEIRIAREERADRIVAKMRGE